MPGHIKPGLIITIQPVGVRFATPLLITFPNFDSPESVLILLDPDSDTFGEVGKMRVSADDKRLETFEGDVRLVDWHFDEKNAKSRNPTPTRITPAAEPATDRAAQPSPSATTVIVDLPLFCFAHFSRSSMTEYILNYRLKTWVRYSLLYCS